MTITLSDNYWQASTIIPKALDRKRAWDEIVTARNVWQAALHKHFPDAKVDITISFGSRPPGTIASTIHKGTKDGVRTVEIIFDNNKETKFHHREAGWFGRIGKLSFYTVALHEIGHALGIPHNQRIGSIMETFAGYGRWKGGLSQWDIDNAVKELTKKGDVK